MRRLNARFFFGALCIYICFAICACGSRSGFSSFAASAAAPSAPSAGSESAAPEQKAPAAELTGRVARLDEEDFSFSRSPVLGAEGDKRSFDTLLDSLSGKAARITVGDGFSSAGDAADTGYALTSEQAGEILSLLQKIRYAVFSSPPDPVAGSTIHLLVFDAADSCLLHASFDGDWLVLEGESGPRVFDGKGCGLEGIADLAARP